MKFSLNFNKIWNRRQIILRVAIISLLIIATLFLFLFGTGAEDPEMVENQTTAGTQDPTEQVLKEEVIIVDVSGAVKNPAVIQLPVDSRIEDAIQAAGGLTKDADVTNINRAAILGDGEKVLIPTIPKEKEGSQTPSNISTNGHNNSTDENGVVNINTATSEGLQQIPGIGPATAEKILQYRDTNGLFRKVEELKKISGIGDKTFEKMKPYICI